MPNINWKVLCFASLFICICLLAYYVWQIRYLTSGSFLVGEYRTQVAQLLREKKDLEIEFAENGFLEKAQKNIRDLNFVKTTSVKYIQFPDNYLAKAE